MLLRQSLLFLSRHKEFEQFLKSNPLSRKIYKRFIAGETRTDALKAAHRLNQEGFKVTLDYLGEEVSDSEHAEAAAEKYAQAIEEAKEQGLDTGLSVKLSHLGIRIDEKLALENLENIVVRAARVGGFVRVDMEGSDLTEQTLKMVRQLHRDHNNIGTVLQSYLRRSSADLEVLNREKIPVRLVKGTYLEPDEVAFQDKEEVSLYFLRLCETLIRAGTHPAIATHDAHLIEFANDIAYIFSRPETDYEFQMLYGIRYDLAQKLIKQGHRVRIYLPYGEDWYGYFMRRLAERPANLWFLMKPLRK